MNREWFINRKELASFLSPQAVRQFEEMQQAVAIADDTVSANVAATGKLNEAAFITLSENAELPNERVLSLGGGLDFELTDGGVTIRLTDVARTDGGFTVRFVAEGDTLVAVPLTGILATRENVETLSNKTIAAPVLAGLVSASDDVTAAAAGVPAGGMYRSGSYLKFAGGGSGGGGGTGGIGWVDLTDLPAPVLALSGVNTGDQTDITGNAGSATKLLTARTINGVAFDGTANITINAVDSTAREPAITAGTTAQYWRGDKSWQTLDKAAVGLGNVTDVAQTSVTGLTGAMSVAAFKTGLGLVKGDVGLGSVDNTADTAKPVSTAQQTALDLKANLANPQFTGNMFVAQPVPSAALTTTSTLSAPTRMLQGIVQVSGTTAKTITLPTGTNVDSGVLAGALAVGEGWDWSLINLDTVSGTATVAANTNHTLVGSGAIGIGASGRFRTVKTAANTFVTYRLA